MNVAGYVLAGGKSTRMGRDKALLQLGGRTGGRTMVQRVAEAVEQSAGNATLIGDPAKYGRLGYPVIPDLRQGCGPLAGIESALTHSTCEWNLILACDLANSGTEFLKSLCLQALNLQAPNPGTLNPDEAFDCLVPQGPDGRLQPLCAMYRRVCLAPISRALDQGVRRVTDAVTGLRVFVRTVGDLAPFQNLNTPEDWNRYINDRLN
jgi:molybdenum cofactor guanylyltransferase